MPLDREHTRNGKAGDAEMFLRSLANPHRVMILCGLLERQLSVIVLGHCLGLSSLTILSFFIG